jgi:signal transduction histidine kinase
MTGQTINYLLIIVYFIYGMAFFGMGLTLALESEHSPSMTNNRLLRWLAAFGMIHGTHEWIESYLIQFSLTGLPTPTWIPGVRIIFLFSSFSALVIYGALTLRVSPQISKTMRIFGLSLMGIYILGILTSALTTYGISSLFRVYTMDGLTRYLLAVPGAGLTALAIRSEAIGARREGKKDLAGFFHGAAVGFGIYAITQILVPSMEMFPANILNASVFRDFAGFPIQVVRTLAAITITICLLRASQISERDRQEKVLATQNERMQALEQVQINLLEREALRRELLRHIVRAQEDERSRISREIHDETSQVLTAFSLDLATLQNTLPAKSGSKTLVDRLQSLSKQMSQGLYHLVLDLRPAQLDNLGLNSALEYLEENYLAKGLQIDFKISGKTRRLDPIIETVFFRVAQEALTNVLRHAGVNTAEMEMVYQPGQTILKVSDGGVGFDPRQPFTPPHGWGLEGMRERVESVEGELEVVSSPGQGTTITVTIPLPGKNVTAKKGK